VRVPRRARLDEIGAESSEPPAVAPAPISSKRARRGTRTPEVVFYLPILQALDEMGGSGSPPKVIERVGELMKADLKPEDLKPLPNSGIIRWENTARWARNSMIGSGLLRSGSARGHWEIADAGRKYLNSHRQG
jgi:hypothetical protein